MSYSDYTIKIRTWYYPGLHYSYDYYITIEKQGSGYKLIPHNIGGSSWVAETIKIYLYDSNGNLRSNTQLTSEHYPNVTNEELAKLPIINEGDYLTFQGGGDDVNVQIHGPLLNIMDNHDYAKGLLEKGKYYGFRFESNGIYVQYLNQIRVIEGDHIVETAENSNRVLDVSGSNVCVNNFNNSSSTQKFKFTYNDTRKAYKITLVGTGYAVAWNSGMDNNVFMYPDTENYTDQYWYVENAGQDTHQLVNAHNIYRVMNLDSDNINVASKDTNNIKQYFKLRKI